MKTRINSVLLLAATLSVSAFVSLSAATQKDFPVAYAVNTVTASHDGGEQISRGTSRGDVSWAMRHKTGQALSPDIWVYSNYVADLDVANQQGCETLVITFAHDKVVDLKLVNKPAVTVIASNVKVGKPARIIASAK